MAAEIETEKKKITPENAAAELISLMSDGDTDGASSYLDSFSPGEINDILKLVPVESRADALLLLGKDKAVELLRETSDDQEDNFMREIGGADTSRIVDTLYDRDERKPS